MVTEQELMNRTDYCYICIAHAMSGAEQLIGFTKKYEGIKELRETYIQACKEDGNIKEGMTFTAQRWSRNQVIIFFETLKELDKEGVFMFIDFLPELMFVETPKDIDDFLTFKDLYEEENND